MQQIKEGKKELHVVNDKFGTPTYTHDFAATVKLLLNQEWWGVYNLVCEGETRRLEVTRELLRLVKKENSIQLNEVNSDFFKAEYFVERPASEILINAKLNLRQLNSMRDWKICLKEYLENYYSDYFK